MLQFKTFIVFKAPIYIILKSYSVDESIHKSASVYNLEDWKPRPPH